MKTLATLLLMIAILPVSVMCRQNMPGRDSQTIEEFWGAFRKAVASKDHNALATLCEFPFKTRGPLDRDPVVDRDRAAFLGMIDRLLNQDPGLRPEPETMRDLIGRTAVLRPSSDGSSARLGAFVFGRIQGRWRFTMAYLDE